MTGMFMDKKDKEIYDSWTKEQIYKAYLTEVETNKNMLKFNKQLMRKIADYRFKYEKGE